MFETLIYKTLIFKILIRVDPVNRLDTHSTNPHVIFT
jgi:hypothetical protein